MSKYVDLGFIWVYIVMLLSLWITFGIECCVHENAKYATTLFAGHFNYTRRASIDLFNKGHVLLTSSTGNFFLSMTSCKLVIAHNDSSSSHTLVWKMVLSHCVMGNQYTLSFLENGNLVILLTQNVSSTIESPQHKEQTEVWTTNTAGQGVVSMQLDENGNLLLYNSKKDPIWQSFNHPTSILVSSQVLEQGMSLSLKEEFFTFSLVVEPSRVVLYVIDTSNQDPKPYWQLLPNSSSNATVAYAALDKKGNLQLYDSSFNPLIDYHTSEPIEEGLNNFERHDIKATIYDRTKVEANGFGGNNTSLGSNDITTTSTNLGRNMEGYKKVQHEGTLLATNFKSNGVKSTTSLARYEDFGLYRAEITSTVVAEGGSVVKNGGNLEIYFWSGKEGSWNLHSRAIKNRCDFPSACPRYSTCELETQECSCRGPMVAANLEGGYWECQVPPNVAGAPNLAEECKAGERVAFVELKNMSYFALEQGGGAYSASFADCKRSCLHTCSCSAFVFRLHNLLSCYPILEPAAGPRALSSLSFLAIHNPSSSVFLRTSSANILSSWSQDIILLISTLWAINYLHMFPNVIGR